MKSNIEQKAKAVAELLSSNPELNRFVNARLAIPQVHRGVDKVRIIILGQDPTVRHTKSQAGVTTVLNLDRPGSLYNYVTRHITYI